MKYTISRAVHLGRLARFFAGCRHCPHAADTGTLPPRQVKRLEEVGPRGLVRPRFHGEGAGGVYGNELTPADARRMAAAFGLLPPPRVGHPLGRLWPSSPATAGPSAPPWSPPSARDSVGPAATWSTSAPPPPPACVLAIGQLAAAGGILVGNPGGQPRQAGLKFFAPGPSPISADTGSTPLSSPQVEPRSPDAALRLLAAGPGRGRLPGRPVALLPCPAPLRVALDARLPASLEYLRKLTAQVACRLLPCRTGHVAEEVRAGRAHFGFSIEDDGETCRLWDEQGRPVPSERLLLLLARHLLAQTVRRPPSSSRRARRRRWPGRSPRWAAAPSPPIRLARPWRRRCASTTPCWAAVPADAFGTPSADYRCADALRTLTLVLVLLSRDDRPLSEVLDAEAPAG